MNNFLPENFSKIYSKFIDKSNKSYIFKYINEKNDNILNNLPNPILNSGIIFLRWDISNEMNEQKRIDLNKIITLYKNYYNIQNNKIIPLPRGKINRRDYNFRRFGDYLIEQNIPNINESSPEYLKNKLNKRMNEGFNICKEKVENDFEGFEEDFINRIKQFFNEEKNREKRNKNLINSTNNNLQKKISKRCNKILYGPENKPFNKNSLSLCIPNFLVYGNKRENMLFEFEILKNRYLINQKQKPTLFGLIPFLIPYKTCSSFFQVLPLIKLEQNKSHTNSCHQLVMWSITSNKLLLQCSLKKNTDIPMILVIPQNGNHLVPKYQSPLGYEKLDSKKFIGVFLIPYTKTYSRNIFYYILFVFENERKTQKSYLNMSTSYFTIVNMIGEKIDIGAIHPSHTSYSEEISILYYLQSQEEDKIYLYYDVETPTYIFVSKKKLDEMNKNNGEKKYPNLQKTFIERYESRNSINKQYYIRTKEQINKNSSEISRNNYLLKTVSRLDSTFSSSLNSFMNIATSRI